MNSDVQDRVDRVIASERKTADRAFATEILLRNLLNKVNKVTCEFRHTHEVTEKSMHELVDRQIQVEKELSALKGTIS